MNITDRRTFYKDLDLFTWKALGKSIFAMTKEQREQYYQSEEYKEKNIKQEEYERKQKEEAKLKRKEFKQKYSKKERQEYAKKCEEEHAKKCEEGNKIRQVELEKKLEEEEERDRIRKETEAKLQQKTDKYLKAEYLFYKLFDAIEKRKLINFELYKDYNLLLPIYNDFKKSPPYNYYLKDIPKKYILDKYFTSDKIEEIKHFDIFNDTEIQELIDIFTYKPIISGA
jgi:hypothetical protein